MVIDPLFCIEVSNVQLFLLGEATFMLVYRSDHEGGWGSLIVWEKSIVVF
jgi:hypothetical protein